MAQAPPNMLALGRKLQKNLSSARFSGIVGDASHGYGYHLAPYQLSNSDYSMKLALDKGAGVNRNYASALDITLSTAMMKTVTKRFRDAALDPNDTCMEYVREFYGTLDGRTVYGLIHDSAKGAWRSSTSDSSHLWHIHVSFFRRHANSKAAMNAVYSVFMGEADMPSANEIAKAVHNYHIDKIDKKSGSTSRMKNSSYQAWQHEYLKQIKSSLAKASSERAAMVAAIEAVAKGQGADPAAIRKAAEDGAKAALADLDINLNWTTEE